MRTVAVAANATRVDADSVLATLAFTDSENKRDHRSGDQAARRPIEIYRELSLDIRYYSNLHNF